MLIVIVAASALVYLNILFLLLDIDIHHNRVMLALLKQLSQRM